MSYSNAGIANVFLSSATKHPSLRHVQEDVVIAASEGNGVVEHPLLDKVRACSSNPDAAADFFLQLLHPFAIGRMSVEAQYHPYLVETSKTMEAYCEDAPVRTLPYGISLFVEAQQSGRTICSDTLTFAGCCVTHASAKLAHLWCMYTPRRWI